MIMDLVYLTFIYLFIVLCNRYKDVRIGKPSVVMDGVSENLNPHTCRLSEMTYVVIVSYVPFLLTTLYHLWGVL